MRPRRSRPALWSVITDGRLSALGGLSLRQALFLLGLWLGGAGIALAQTGPPVSLGARAVADWGQYRVAGGHRAFALSPAGGWAWVSEMATPEAARAAALRRCKALGGSECQLLDLDGVSQWQPATWRQGWRPYLDAAALRHSAEGVSPGRRFPDLRIQDSSGRSAQLGDWRGRVLILHFWGSWCPPCLKEFPHLAELHRRVQATAGLDLVMLQARERFATALAWAQDQGFGDLPLWDSGADPRQTHFTQPGGETLPDRYLAAVFPTTYVLDGNGVVLFRHQGPIDNWPLYWPLLEDAVAQTGQ